jgi:hypothetical protein
VDIETKGYKKTADSRDEIHERHRAGHSLLDHRRNEDILELKVNPVEKKS